MEQINIQQQQLTTYQLGGETNTLNVFPDKINLNASPVMKLSDQQHNINDTLGRPTVVASGVWNASNNTLTKLRELPLPSILLEVREIAQKASGFLGFRATVCLKLYTSATSKQQGRLMMNFIPNAKMNAVRIKNLERSVTSLSTTHHCVYNIQDSGEVVLRIPYVNQHNMMNLVTGDGEHGVASLYVWVPLRSPQDKEADWTIEGWFEDVDLQFPTDHELYNTCLPTESTDDTAAEGVQFTGKLVDALQIPTRLEQIRPSYLMQEAANVMQLMGYQKKTNTRVVNNVHPQTVPNMANFNGTYTGSKLSLAANNTLYKISSPAGTNEDEMTIRSLIERPARIATIEWRTRQSRNQHIASILVHPMHMVPVTATEFATTPLSYVGACFSSWRGSLTFRVDLTKTKDHSGKLRLVFIPFKYGEHAKTARVRNTYTKLVDISTTTTVTMTIPYVSTLPFMSTYIDQSPGETPNESDYAIGTFMIQASSALRAPEYVEQSMTITIDISAGPDFEFAEPTNPVVYPTSKSYGQLSTEEEFDIVMMTQSTDDTPDIDKISKVPILQSDVPSAACTGEIVKSIKNLCARAALIAEAKFMDSGATMHMIRPFLVKILDSKPTSEDTCFDFIDYFSWCYAYFNGSVRLDVDPQISQDVMLQAALRNNGATYYSQTSLDRYSTRTMGDIRKYQPGRTSFPMAKQLQSSKNGSILQVEVPYYSRSHIMPVQIDIRDNYGPSSVETSTSIVDFRSTDNVNMRPAIYRQCGDDFRLYYYIGSPIVTFLPGAILEPDHQLNLHTLLTRQSILFERDSVHIGLHPFQKTYYYESLFHSHNYIVGYTKEAGLTIFAANQDMRLYKDKSYINIKGLSASRYGIKEFVPWAKKKEGNLMGFFDNLNINNGHLEARLHNVRIDAHSVQGRPRYISNAFTYDSGKYTLAAHTLVLVDTTNVKLLPKGTQFIESNRNFYTADSKIFDFIFDVNLTEHDDMQAQFIYL